MFICIWRKIKTEDKDEIKIRELAPSLEQIKHKYKQGKQIVKQGRGKDRNKKKY